MKNRLVVGLKLLRHIYGDSGTLYNNRVKTFESGQLVLCTMLVHFMRKVVSRTITCRQAQELKGQGWNVVMVARR